jgi:hypothetical protein
MRIEILSWINIEFDFAGRRNTNTRIANIYHQLLGRFADDPFRTIRLMFQPHECELEDLLRIPPTMFKGHHCIEVVKITKSLPRFNHHKFKDVIQKFHVALCHDAVIGRSDTEDENEDVNMEFRPRWQYIAERTTRLDILKLVVHGTSACDDEVLDMLQTMIEIAAPNLEHLGWDWDAVSIGADFPMLCSLELAQVDPDYWCAVSVAEMVDAVVRAPLLNRLTVFRVTIRDKNDKNYVQMYQNGLENRGLDLVIEELEYGSAEDDDNIFEKTVSALTQFCKYVNSVTVGEIDEEWLERMPEIREACPNVEFHVPTKATLVYE